MTAKVTSLTLLIVAVATLLATKSQMGVEAVNCSALELSPCGSAIFSGAAPTMQCCAKLREQRPCLCKYYRDPNLKQYVNSPGAKRVSKDCQVSVSC